MKKYHVDERPQCTVAYLIWTCSDLYPQKKQPNMLQISNPYMHMPIELTSDEQLEENRRLLARLEVNEREKIELIRQNENLMQENKASELERSELQERFIETLQERDFLFELTNISNELTEIYESKISQLLEQMRATEDLANKQMQEIEKIRIERHKILRRLRKEEQSRKSLLNILKISHKSIALYENEIASITEESTESKMEVFTLKQEKVRHQREINKILVQLRRLDEAENRNSSMTRELYDIFYGMRNPEIVEMSEFLSILLMAVSRRLITWNSNEIYEYSLDDEDDDAMWEE